MTKVLLRQTCVCRDKTRLLLQQKYARHNKTFVENIFVMTNISVCRNKSFVITSILLSQQSYVCQTDICHDKSFVTKKKCLLQQTCFCCNKRCILSQQTCVCRDKKIILVAAPASDMCVAAGMQEECGREALFHQTGLTSSVQSWLTE